VSSPESTSNSRRKHHRTGEEDVNSGDKAFVNGTIITMETGQPAATALVSAEDRILYIGNDRDARRYTDSVTTIHDLKGKTVIPGLIDNHVHFLATCVRMLMIDLSECRSISEIQNKMRTGACGTPKGKWLRGYHFDQGLFPDSRRLPTRWDLDEVSTDHPIIIERICMHLFVVNSAALEIIDIDPRMLSHKKQEIDEKTGEPNGIFCEKDADILLKKIPDIVETDVQKENALITGLKDAAGLGLTSIRPCDVAALNLPDPPFLYQLLDKQGRLPVRVCIDSDRMETLSDMAAQETEKVKSGSYKLFIDGALGSWTAALSVPYHDRPDTTGILNYSQKELDSLIVEAYQAGVQVAMHAIGDNANAMAITGMENVLSKCGRRPNTRFRLIHASVMREDLLDRLDKLPVVVDVQPVLLRQSILWAENRLGPERTRLLYPFRTFIERGIRLAGGSDSPGEGMNPFYGIYFAVTRKNLQGHPSAGWYPDQKLTVHQALELFTANAAYSAYEENLKGSLTKGKYADFVVIDKNILEIPVDEIKNISALATVCGGEIVYDNHFFST
jgi:predicted amidohydrolase YtcJ